jgi:hypothetical protein
MIQYYLDSVGLQTATCSLRNVQIRLHPSRYIAAVSGIIRLRLEFSATSCKNTSTINDVPLVVVISRDLYANITDQERNSDLRLLTLQ